MQASKKYKCYFFLFCFLEFSNFHDILKFIGKYVCLNFRRPEMKKLIPLLMLFIAAVLVLSCASGAQTTAPEPVEPEPVVQETETETQTENEIPEPVPPKQDLKRDKTGIIIEGAARYKIRNGDTLSNIAKKQYGNENGYYFPLILMASENAIRDPDIIVPNGNLVIPDLKANLNDSEARSKMKTFFADVAESYNEKSTPGAAKMRTEINRLSRSF